MAAAITERGYPSDYAVNIAWARAGTAVFLDTVAGLSDAELDAESPLPDWTRRHVIAHLARNAEGLGRLLTWARTGVETLMYPSAESRDAGIQASAQEPAAQLRADVVAASTTLLDEFDAMPVAAWSVLIATRGSGPVPTSVVPWFRSREVWIHAVDLGADVAFTDFPVDFSAALVTELVSGLNVRSGADLLLVAADTGEQWTIGGGAIRVEAPVGELASWLTGRTTRPEAQLPAWI